MKEKAATSKGEKIELPWRVPFFGPGAAIRLPILGSNFFSKENIVKSTLNQTRANLRFQAKLRDLVSR
jgi:hypothetical protein